MAERQSICCLRRLGGKATASAVIPLEGETEVTIGRDPDCTVRFGAKNTMLSRKHAILKKTSTSWSITDNNSINGIFINSTKIPPGEPVEISDGDEIQLGVPRVSGQPAEFVWRFYKALKVKKMTCSKEALKRPADESTRPKSPAHDPPAKCVRPNTGDRLSPTDKYKKKMAELQKQTEKKLKQQQLELEEMKRKLKEESKAHQETTEKLKADYEAEQERIKAELRVQYEKDLLVNENNLRRMLMKEREKLEDERDRIEKTYLEQLNEQILERETDIQQEMTRERTRIDSVIQQKDIQLKMLGEQLEDIKDAQKNETDKESDFLEARAVVLNDVAQLMEIELQCSICTELYIEASTLNCSHSFCGYCIGVWMETKLECPVCRAEVTSQLRSVVLDSYIERMLDYFPPDKQEERNGVVVKRKVDEEKRKAAKKAKEEEAARRAAERAASTSGRRGGRRRRRGAPRELESPIPASSHLSHVGLVMVESIRRRL